MNRKSIKASDTNKEAVVAARADDASADPGRKPRKPANGVHGPEPSRSNEATHRIAFLREIEERDDKALEALRNRERLVEHAAANFAVSYVREAVDAGTLREGDGYVAQVLSFATDGLRRRGALIGPDGRPAGALVPTTIDIERTRRRALAIACEELRSAIAHCRTQRRETEDSVRYLDGAFNDLEIMAWVEGAVSRYVEGVALIPLTVQVNPLTRALEKLPRRRDDGSVPHPGTAPLANTILRVGGVDLSEPLT